MLHIVKLCFTLTGNISNCFAHVYFFKKTGLGSVIPRITEQIELEETLKII